MPRTQGKNIPRSGIAEKEWTVYENYEFGKSKVQLIDTLRDNQERAAAKIDLLHSYVEVDAIIKTGEQADSYSLSDIEIHETLLADFHEIYNRVDALNYVKRRGFLSSDFEPMREPNLPLNHGCLVEEVLDSAAYIRWLMSLSDSITSNKILKMRQPSCIWCIFQVWLTRMPRCDMSSFPPVMRALMLLCYPLKL